MVLKSFDAELRGEIGKTDSREYKAALHGEGAVIKKLIEKVSLQKALRIIAPIPIVREPYIEDSPCNRTKKENI